MKLAVFILVVLSVSVRAAVPAFNSFEPTQFDTNSLSIKYRADWTNDVGVLSPATVNTLVTVTNESVYGTWSTPSKVTLLSLGTNQLDMTLQSAWLLNSPTNDSTQVILSLSAGAYQGQHAFLLSQNGGEGFTLPNNSEQYNVPGAFVILGSDWVGTTNRGIHLVYSAPDWVLEGVPTDPSVPGGGGGGGDTLWTNLNNVAYLPIHLTGSTAFPTYDSTNSFISLTNATPADIVNSQQYPPGILFSAAVWNTTSNASHTVSFMQGAVPIPGDPTGGLMQWDAFHIEGDTVTTTAPFGFTADGDANVLRNLNIRNLGYIWPVAQGSGTLENDGTGILTWTGGGGSPLWSLTGGDTLVPSPAVGLVSIVSTLADNATNVALNVDTGVPWSAYPSLLASFKNSGTNMVTFSPLGGLTIGNASSQLGGPYMSGILSQTTSDVVGTTVTYLFEHAFDLNENTYSQFYWNTFTNAFGLVMEAVDNDSNGHVEFILNMNSDTSVAPRINLKAKAENVTLIEFEPTIASTGSSVAYLFDTSNTQTNGDFLVSIKNATVPMYTFSASLTNPVVSVFNNNSKATQVGIGTSGTGFVSSTDLLTLSGSSGTLSIGSSNVLPTPDNTLSFGTTSFKFKDMVMGDPGSGAAVWRLGKKLSGSVLTLTTNYYEVMVDGVVGAIPIVTVTP